MNTSVSSSSSSSTASRVGHLVPASLVLALAAVVAWLSYTQEPAGAFLFPRLIGTVMLALALWNFIRAAMGVSKVGHGIAANTWLNIIPGIALMAVFIFFAAKYFGFYVASTGAFFLLYSGYDPTPHTALSSWVKRVVITVLFMGVVYALFTLLLKVQTPRGLFL